MTRAVGAGRLFLSLTSVSAASAPTHEQDEGYAKNVSLTSLPSPPHTQYRTPGAQSSAFHPGCNAAGPFHSATPRPYVHKSCPFRAFRPPAFHEIIPRVISLLLRSTPFHSWQFHFLSSCPPSSPLRGLEISDCPASPTMFYSRDSARLPHCLSRCLSRRPFS